AEITAEATKIQKVAPLVDCTNRDELRIGSGHENILVPVQFDREVLNSHEERPAAPDLESVVKFDADGIDGGDPGVRRGEYLLLAPLDVDLQEVDSVEAELLPDLVDSDCTDEIAARDRCVRL